MGKQNSIKAGTLVIVESPSKAKTIHKYLGDDYIISSSVGHIIDLPKSRLAIDIENNFKPEYITIRGKAKILNELKKQAASRVRACSWRLTRTARERRYHGTSPTPWPIKTATSSGSSSTRSPSTR